MADFLISGLFILMSLIGVAVAMWLFQKGLGDQADRNRKHDGADKTPPRHRQGRAAPHSDDDHESA